MAKESPKGFTVWFTGLPCSGKSTLALLLRERLLDRGFPNIELFDGDELRRHLSAGLGFSKADRDTHILRVGYVCHLLTRNGVPNLAAVISPYRAIRDAVRAQIGRFVEVFVKCPVEVCAKRDVKGMYEKAFRGEIPNFTGVSDPYEEPLAPEVVVETDKKDPKACVAQILTRLEELRFVEPSDYVYSEEEMQTIRARLQGLGYLD